MNIFKKMYCRTFQTIFKWAIPILPYSQPKILQNMQELASMLNEKNIKKVLVVTDKGISSLGLTKDMEESLANQNIEVCIYDDTVANPTSDNVEDARVMYIEQGCEALIGFGGGSAIDCAKAVGARIARPKKTLTKMKGLLKVGRKLPLLIAVPTTAGTGSETTLASVIVDAQTRHKYTINDFNLIPSYAVLDATLTEGLPQSITASTGIDALTHAVEAYIGRSTTKETRGNALEATKLIFENLLDAYDNGSNLLARDNMLRASYMAGLAFTKSYVGYVHAISHSLSGKYNLAHGYTNAVILPYVLKKYDRAIYKKLWELGSYAGLFGEEVSFEEGAKLFIYKLEDMLRYMNIGKYIPQIQKEDISELAEKAEKEANPLYPVPILWGKEELAKIYYEVKGND